MLSICRTIVLLWIISTQLALVMGQADQSPQGHALAKKHDFVALEAECLEAIKDREACKQIAEKLESSYSKDETPEAIQMLCSILRGGNMGPGSGWFKPASTKYDWSWLVDRFELQESESIIPDDIRDAKLFGRLDRNGDRFINADDLDWSPNSSWVREAGILINVFRMSDDDRDSSVTREEWLKLFDRISAGNSSVGADAFRRAFPIGQSSSGYRSGDEPTEQRLVRGFFTSEIGSHSEGPRLNSAAPDFELSTFDQSSKIRLSSLLQQNKPIVLIFGNYTCGPFRRMFPEFDTIAKRYSDQVAFVGIYVREAHPEDGWIMESNSSMGVKLPQPKSLPEREKVAQTCATTLNYSFPLLVDTLDDAVGNAYSGMPARAYLINTDGTVIYKSGRGPFGFIPGELEQAIVMRLLERQSR